MGAEKRGYHLSRLATADLEEIWLYSSETWSEEQADRYQNDLVQAFLYLASGVKIGRIVGIRDGYYKYAVGSHFIYYRFGSLRIEIIRVLHQKMDVSKQL